METNDNRIYIKGYNFVGAHFPGYNKGEVYVCMYYKDHLLLIRRGDLFTLQENLETKRKEHFLHVFIHPQVKIKFNFACQN